MAKYNKILILHSVDHSTMFLKQFEDHFPDIYISFDSSDTSVNTAKEALGNLEDPSLIIYLGHGSSEGLYLPNENFDYSNLFLDINWGNIFFENHDIILLSCRSNELLYRIYKYNSALGFGNILSSPHEVEHHNKYNDNKKILTNYDISIFNKTYVQISIMIVKMILKDEINFDQVHKYYYYLINKEINKILLNEYLENRIEIARLLFELRNEMTFRKHIKH